MPDAPNTVNVHGEVTHISKMTVDITISGGHGRTRKFTLSRELFPDQVKIGSICCISVSLARARPQAPCQESEVSHNVD